MPEALDLLEDNTVTPIGIPQVRRKVAKPRRLVFFDLDNTLIPTSWIMQHWKSSEQKTPQHQIVKNINRALVEAGLFTAIDDLLAQVTNLTDSVHIVTNAGFRTVENFYLTHTLPQLKNILRRNNVTVTSTEDWVTREGPVPSPDNDEAFREFYTGVKYSEFREITRDSVKRCDEDNCKLDVISIGDQMCEITAACRLGAEFSPAINLIKLILILDPANERFNSQTPTTFVRHIRNLTDHVVWLLQRTVSTTLSNTENLSQIYNRTGDEGSKSEADEIVYWFPMPHNLTYAVGSSSNFSSDTPAYLPLEYTESVYSHESLWEILGYGRNASDRSSTACDSVYEAEVPCKLTTQSEAEDIVSELNLS